LGKSLKYYVWNKHCRYPFCLVEFENLQVPKLHDILDYSSGFLLQLKVTVHLMVIQTTTKIFKIWLENKS